MKLPDKSALVMDSSSAFKHYFIYSQKFKSPSMATNKNAITRYKALDHCFRNRGRKYFIEDLVEACNQALRDMDPQSSGIQRRQVFDDIRFMSSETGYGAPIEKFRDGRRTFYRYSDVHFSITNQPLNEQEARLLTNTIQTLSRFKGLPQFEWLEETKTRLEQTFKLRTEEEIMSFDENPYLQGQKHLSTLYNAIVNKIALSITYQSFRKSEYEVFNISPWRLKQYNNRWFLFGLNHYDYEQITNIPLDRIVKIEEEKTYFHPNDRIDFDEYFEDIIGVTLYDGKVPEKIIIKIDDGLWPYIKTKPLHGSQKVLERHDNHVIIQLEVIPNYELESLILSRGEELEVIAPPHFREKMAARINKMIQRYAAELCR